MTAALLVVVAAFTWLHRPSPAAARLLGPRLRPAPRPAPPAGRVPVRLRRWRWRQTGGVVACLGGSLAALAAGLAIPVAVAVAIGIAVAVLLAGSAVGTRRERAAAERLTTALELLFAELSAGSREADALSAAASAAPDNPHLLRAGEVARLGLDVAPALSGVALAALAASWRVRAECGAPLAGLVGHVAHDARSASARRRAAETALAGPVSSSTMLALLPGLGMALGAAMGAHPMRFLLSSGPGSVELLVGVVLDALGCGWMYLFVRAARR